MCRRHCIVQHNNCQAPLHTASALTARQRDKLPIEDSDLYPPPSGTEMGDRLLELFPNSVATLQARSMQDQAHQDREDREFELNLGQFLSPLPAFNEADFSITDEDSDLCLAVEQSLLPILDSQSTSSQPQATLSGSHASSSSAIQL